MSKKDKINIVVVLPFLSGEGGTETVVSEWISHFNRSSAFNMTFLLPQGSMKPNWYPSFKSVRVFRFAQLFKNVRSVRNIFGALWLAIKVLTTSADEVVCLSTKLIFEVSFLKKMFRKKFKIISWIHFSLQHGQDINLSDLKKADFHLAISSGIQQQMRDIDISESRISIIGNPIPKGDHIIPNSSTKKTRFIYSGRIFVDGQKNLRELVSGLSELNAYTQEWKLDVFGDGPDMETFQKLLIHKGIFDQVVLHGWVKQPFNQLSSADCLVLTSKYEGFGMVLGEAIARGIPVISSDCPTGPADIVGDENGYLYPPGDVYLLRKRLIAMVNKEKDFDHKRLPETVSKFYPNSYFKRLEQSLFDFSQ